MPIYAYKCESCGFAKDVLQKISDATLTDCPNCGASAFRKQLTAAGFQLKGSGWYATDFKGSGAPPAPGDKSADGEKKTDGDKKTEGEKKTEGDKKSDAKPAEAGAAKPNPGTPAKTDSAPTTGS